MVCEDEEKDEGSERGLNSHKMMVADSFRTVKMWTMKSMYGISQRMNDPGKSHVNYKVLEIEHEVSLYHISIIFGDGGRHLH